jgi:hypothetical protein
LKDETDHDETIAHHLLEKLAALDLLRDGTSVSHVQ